MFNNYSTSRTYPQKLMAQWKKVFSFLYQASCQYYFMLKINYIILAESTCYVFLVFPEVLEG